MFSAGMKRTAVGRTGFEQQPARVARCDHLACDGLVELDGQQQAHAAHFLDGVLVRSLHAFESGLEPFSHYAAVLHPALFNDGVDHREGRRRGQGVAAVRAAVVAGAKHVAGVLAHEGADGHAAADGLRQRHHVGLDVELLVAKERAQPADARLNLVQNEQQAIFVTPLADGLEVALRGQDDAALALHGLQHDGAGARGGRSL